MNGGGGHVEISSHRVIIPELEAAPDSVYAFWSMDDKIALASYYGVKDTFALAKYLGKSTGKIQSQAKKLNVHFGMTDEERDEVILRIKAGDI